MKYKLHALSIYEVGQRKDKKGNPHQEDFIFPKTDKKNDNNRLFILCDGIGGHSSGELASRTVCETISQHIKKADERCFTDNIFLSALDKAYDKLDELDNNPNSLRKMGTTLTFLMFHKKGATLAHIGDSRIYHIRPCSGNSKDIIFRTYDHSLVNDLIKIGELSPEEAKNYPHKNVLTRAIQPNMEKREQADIFHTENICSGDYFFMCSDGMLEQMEDDLLCSILFDKTTDEEKIEILRTITQNNKDNHSAHLIHIIDVTKYDTIFSLIDKKLTKHQNESNRIFLFILFCIMVIASLLLLFYLKTPNRVEKLRDYLY